MKENGNPMEIFQGLLEDMLRLSNNNLDAYISGSRFEVGKSSIKPEMIEKLVSILPEIDEKYIAKMADEKKEYTKSSKFFDWLSGYVKSIKGIFSKTKPINDLDEKDFDALTGYVIQNIILHNIGINVAAAEKNNNLVYSVSNISVLSFIVDKYFESIFYNDVSKSVANSSIHQNTGISEEKCNVFWEYYLKEEQALWRKYSMKLQVNIEKRLDDLLEALFDIEEE